jgi:maltose alpha-D-glucosyltransferase/alpha-amylase
MLRSFSYAAYSSLIKFSTRHPKDIASLEPWAQLWVRCVTAEFLRAYRETAQGAEFLPVDSAEFRRVLDVFLVDKALYEVLYELNARPAWVRIPLMGIISLQL